MATTTSTTTVKRFSNPPLVSILEKAVGSHTDTTILPAIKKYQAAYRSNEDFAKDQLCAELHAEFASYGRHCTVSIPISPARQLRCFFCSEPNYVQTLTYLLDNAAIPFSIDNDMKASFSRVPDIEKTTRTTRFVCPFPVACDTFYLCNVHTYQLTLGHGHQLRINNTLLKALLGKSSPHQALGGNLYLTCAQCKSTLDPTEQSLRFEASDNVMWHLNKPAAASEDDSASDSDSAASGQHHQPQAICHRCNRANNNRSDVSFPAFGIASILNAHNALGKHSLGKIKPERLARLAVVRAMLVHSIGYSMKDATELVGKAMFYSQEIPLMSALCDKLTRSTKRSPSPLLAIVDQLRCADKIDVEDEHCEHQYKLATEAGLVALALDSNEKLQEIITVLSSRASATAASSLSSLEQAGSVMLPTAPNVSEFLTEGEAAAAAATAAADPNTNDQDDDNVQAFSIDDIPDAPTPLGLSELASTGDANTETLSMVSASGTRVDIPTGPIGTTLIGGVPLLYPAHGRNTPVLPPSMKEYAEDKKSANRKVYLESPGPVRERINLKRTTAFVSPVVHAAIRDFKAIIAAAEALEEELAADPELCKLAEKNVEKYEKELTRRRNSLMPMVAAMRVRANDITSAVKAGNRQVDAAPAPAPSSSSSSSTSAAVTAVATETRPTSTKRTSKAAGLKIQFDTSAKEQDGATTKLTKKRKTAKTSETTNADD